MNLTMTERLENKEKKWLGFLQVDSVFFRAVLGAQQNWVQGIEVIYIFSAPIPSSNVLLHSDIGKYNGWKRGSYKCGN